MLHARGPVLGVLVLLGACATQLAEPDLGRLYARLAYNPKYPLIVIPGTFGSQLVDAETREEAWPGGLWNLIDGGLVARYYMRFGAENVLDRSITPHLITQTGAQKIRRTVLIGTPNYGSVTALQNGIEGMGLGVTRLAPEIEATMPGSYQLLPHPKRTWMLDINGVALDIDLCLVNRTREHPQ